MEVEKVAAAIWDEREKGATAESVGSGSILLKIPQYVR